jgi:hypothetical protein
VSSSVSLEVVGEEGEHGGIESTALTAGKAAAEALVVVLGAEAGASAARATVAEAAIRTAHATFFISMVFLGSSSGSARLETGNKLKP